jgi:argininosuccinate lyase
MVAATDIADLLVRKGMPFREAHGVVGALVRAAVESARPLSALTPEEVASHSELLGEDYYSALRDGAWIDSKVSAGGTGAERLAEQLRVARRVVDDLRSGRD